MSARRPRPRPSTPASPTTAATAPESPPTPSTPPDPALLQQAVKAETEYRLLRVTDWLLQGRPRHEVVVEAQFTWKISQRTAQGYVQVACQRLQEEAFQEQPIFYLRVSQLQRSRLVQLVMGAMAKVGELDPRALVAVARLAETACRILDSRDRTAERIQEQLGRAEAPPRATSVASLTAEISRLLAERNGHAAPGEGEPEARPDMDPAMAANLAPAAPSADRGEAKGCPDKDPGQGAELAPEGCGGEPRENASAADEPDGLGYFAAVCKVQPDKDLDEDAGEPPALAPDRACCALAT